MSWCCLLGTLNPPGPPPLFSVLAGKHQVRYAHLVCGKRGPKSFPFLARRALVAWELACEDATCDIAADLTAYRYL